MTNEFVELYYKSIDFLKEIKKVIDESPYVGYSPDKFKINDYEVSIKKQEKASIPGSCPTYKITDLAITTCESDDKSPSLIMKYNVKQVGTSESTNYDVQINRNLIEFMLNCSIDDFKNYAEMKSDRDLITELLDKLNGFNIKEKV